MEEKSFGIYILTYPGDFHLSTMLVRSIQQVSPNIPIMIIPGDFWGEMGYQDRDFWSFQRPFETFPYLDADTICAKSLDGLAERIARQEGDFIYVPSNVRDEDWQSWVADRDHPKYKQCIRLVEDEFGADLLDRFDPEHDFFSHIPFNSGVFASRRMAIKEADVATLNQRERAFYRDVLGIEDWTWNPVRSSDTAPRVA